MRTDLSRRALVIGAASLAPASAFARAPSSVRQAPAGERALASLACSPDGRRLAVGGQDGVLSLWSRSDLSPSGRRAVSGEEVFSLAWNAGGDRVAVGSGDGRVRILSSETLEILADIPAPGPVTALGFLPDGLLAAGAMGGHVLVVDPSDGRTVRSFSVSAGLMAGAFAPDGASMVVTNPGRRIALADGAVLGRLSGGGEVHAIAFSREGDLLASTHWSGELRLWRDGAETPQVLKPMIATRVMGSGNAMPVDVAMPLTGLAISPDGNVVAAGCIDRRLRFWDARTGALLTTTGRHPHAVASMTYTPDGRELCTADLGGVVRVWAAPGGRLAEGQEV